MNFSKAKFSGEGWWGFYVGGTFHGGIFFGGSEISHGEGGRFPGNNWKAHQKSNK